MGIVRNSNMNLEYSILFSIKSVTGNWSSHTTSNAASTADTPITLIQGPPGTGKTHNCKSFSLVEFR